MVDLAASLDVGIITIGAAVTGEAGFGDGGQRGVVLAGVAGDGLADVPVGVVCVGVVLAVLVLFLQYLQGLGVQLQTLLVGLLGSGGGRLLGGLLQLHRLAGGEAQLELVLGLRVRVALLGWRRWSRWRWLRGGRWLRA